MSTLFVSGETESAQEAASFEDDLAELLVDCHAFVEATLTSRPGSSVSRDGRLLLERLSRFVELQTVH